MKTAHFADGLIHSSSPPVPAADWFVCPPMYPVMLCSSMVPARSAFSVRRAYRCFATRAPLSASTPAMHSVTVRVNLSPHGTTQDLTLAFTLDEMIGELKDMLVDIGRLLDEIPVIPHAEQRWVLCSPDATGSFFRTTLHDDSRTLASYNPPRGFVLQVEQMFRHTAKKRLAYEQGRSRSTGE